MGTFKENRAFLLGLIGEEWTRSRDIFAQGERRMLSRHLKRALRDGLIVVRRASRNEVYYKKNPTEVELNLMKVIERAKELMVSPRIFDDDYIARMRAKIESGEVDMAQLGTEVGVFERQKRVLNECIENLHGAYRSMLNMERPKEPSPWKITSEYSTIMREDLDEYLADGYEIHDVITHEVITMRKRASAYHFRYPLSRQGS